MRRCVALLAVALVLLALATGVSAGFALAPPAAVCELVQPLAVATPVGEDPRVEYAPGWFSPASLRGPPALHLSREVQTTPKEERWSERNDSRRSWPI